MSVQNIIDPATGKIDNQYIDFVGAGVVTNPLTSNIDGQTAYGLNDANLVSTGVLQADAIEAYSTLPGAPIAVLANVKLQTPAKQIEFEDLTGANSIGSLAQLDINAGGKIVLNAATSVEIPKVGGPTELVLTGNGGSLFVRNDAGYGEVVCNEPLRLIGEAFNPGLAAAYIDTSALKVQAGNDNPTVYANSTAGTATVMAKSGTTEAKLEAGAVPKVILSGPGATTPLELIYDEAAAKLYTAGGSAGSQLSDVELLTTNFRVSTGALEGVEIVSGGSESVVRGLGLPLIIAKNAGDQATHNITFDYTGATTITAPTGVRTAADAGTMDGAANTITTGDTTNYTSQTFDVSTKSGTANGYIQNYQKIFLGTTPYWVPLLSYNPMAVPAPDLDFASSSYDSGTGLMTLYWNGNGSAYYKVFRRDGKAYMTNVGDDGPANRYGTIAYDDVQQTSDNLILFDIGSNVGTKFNFFVYGYDALGNRSAVPKSQYYLRNDGSQITFCESPIYLFKINQPNPIWNDFTGNAYPGSTATFVNNYENPPNFATLDWTNSIDVNGGQDFPQIPAILNTTSDPINTTTFPV